MSCYYDCRKMADAHGLLPGNLLEVSDGESTHTQARLKGKKTWVRIPHDQCLRNFWDQRCEAMLKQVGYVKVNGWASVFRLHELDLFLVVHVDDFKMSGPAKHLLISKVIKMEEPRQLKRYLGRAHEFSQQLLRGHSDPRLAWTVGDPPGKELT